MLSITLGTLLATAGAVAAAPSEEFQAPRTAQVIPARVADELQAPRGEEFQAPRSLQSGT
jgi:hypothetical protein